jgi:Tetratricopeptide repeat.
MKRTIPLLLLVACAIPARGADELYQRAFDPVEEFSRLDSRRNEKAPQLDPKRIINASNSFLKEREPEMTAEEYALYEKVMTMLGTNPAFAIRLLEAMMKEENPSPAFEFILGNAYYSAGEVEKSEKHYRSAVERFPTFLRAWNNLGVLYYTTDRYAEAIPCFSKSVVLGDKDPTTFGLLGYSLEKQGNIVAAEMAYMQALAGAPGNVDWQEGLLRIYILGRQFGRAEPLVKSLIKAQPRENRFWLAYGNILLSENRKVEAMAVMETAVNLGIAGAEDMVLLGDLYAEQKLVPEALAIYERVFGPDQELGERKLLHYGQVLLAGNRLDATEQVVSVLGRTRLSASGQIAAQQLRAELLAAREDWAGARAVVETLLKQAPMDGRALILLGRTYTAEEDWPRAQLAFEAAYRVPAATYRASLELANIELKNRRFERSVEYLEKALSIRKTDGVEDYLARVRTLAEKGNESAL